MYNDAVFACNGKEKTCHDSIVSMFNNIAKEMPSEKIEIIGSTAAYMMDYDIFKTHYVCKVDPYDRKVRRVYYTKPLEPMDLDIRVESQEVAEKLLHRLVDIATETKLLTIREEILCLYGFASCLRIEIDVANTSTQLVDISYPRTGVYPLEDFILRARVVLGQTSYKPYIYEEKLTSWQKHDYWVNWVFRNNTLLIPTEIKYQSIIDHYPNTPSYMGMLYNQFRRWNKRAHRLTPNPEHKNQQEFLTNLINRNVYVDNNVIYIRCFICRECITMDQILRNHNTFARHVIVKNTQICIRCCNFRLHDQHSGAANDMLDYVDENYSKYAQWNKHSNLMYLKQSDYFDSKYECCICYKNRIDTQLACGHIFCEPCIKNWKQNGQTKCPECKATLTIGREICGNRITKELVAAIPSFEKINVSFDVPRLMSFHEISMPDIQNLN